MYGRRYQLLIGRAYAQQSTNSAIPSVPATEAVTTQTLDRTYYDASVSFDTVWRKKTPEEIAEEQRQILQNYAGLKGEFKNLVYQDPSELDSLAGWLDENNIVITDHHIEFSVEKIGSNSSEGNEGEITLYNLSDATARLLQVLSATQNFVELSAGYEDEELRVIMRGNMKYAEDVFDGQDRRTKILVNDGGNFAQNQMSVKVYPKGTPIVDLVDDMIEDLSLPRGNIVQIGGYGTLSKPLIVHGKSIDQLKRVLNNFGFVINIQDLFINIYNKRIDETINEFFSQSGDFEARNIPLVTHDTGLLASPAFLTDTSDQTAQEIANESATGIKFKHLLSGEFTPNSFVKLETDDFVGVYRILKVTHTGSLEGDEWFSEVEAERIDYRTRVTPINVDPDEEDDNDSAYVQAPEGFYGRGSTSTGTSNNTGDRDGAFGGFQR